mmetsp:Transcript_40827/g.95332  ORF Transcript_40827/g.95332 Transcript_40827/m.95332 type:complete len:350 (-) Transcript_40827:652-1701(-)
MEHEETQQELLRHRRDERVLTDESSHDRLGRHHRHALLEQDLLESARVVVRVAVRQDHVRDLARGDAVEAQIVRRVRGRVDEDAAAAHPQHETGGGAVGREAVGRAKHCDAEIGRLELLHRVERARRSRGHQDVRRVGDGRRQVAVDAGDHLAVDDHLVRGARVDHGESAALARQLHLQLAVVVVLENGKVEQSGRADDAAVARFLEVVDLAQVVGSRVIDRAVTEHRVLVLGEEILFRRPLENLVHHLLDHVGRLRRAAQPRRRPLDEEVPVSGELHLARVGAELEVKTLLWHDEDRRHVEVHQHRVLDGLGRQPELHSTVFGLDVHASARQVDGRSRSADDGRASFY